MYSLFRPFLFQKLWGISCPGCGLTRGFLAILHLEFSAAWAYNILSIPLFCGIALYTSFGAADAFTGTHLVSAMEGILSKKYMVPIYILVWLLTFWSNNHS